MAKLVLSNTNHETELASSEVLIRDVVIDPERGETKVSTLKVSTLIAP